jgi:hypothetical protein
MTGLIVWAVITGAILAGLIIWLVLSLVAAAAMKPPKPHLRLIRGGRP